MIIPARITKTGKPIPAITVDDNPPAEITSRSWCDRGNNYPSAKIDGKVVSLHRYALFLRNGVWPSSDVDHINGNTWDARTVNLRIVDRATNIRNRHAARKPGKLPPHVYKRHENDRRAMYRVRFRVGGRDHQVGCFTTVDEAGRVADAVKAILREHDTERYAADQLARQKAGETLRLFAGAEGGAE